MQRKAGKDEGAVMVKVSIILPSLNVGPYIEECLNSVMAQTLNEIEIICIDAGSTDGTWETLLNASAMDKRIRLIHSEIKSYGAQVNQGIKAAHGEYVAILETDDYVSHDMYEKLYNIAKREDVDYVKADYTSFYTLRNGNRIFNKVKLFEDKPYLYNKVINPHEIDDIYMKDMTLWKGIYKKNFLTKNGIYLNESPGAAYQDIGFKCLVLLYAKRAYYVDNPLYYYRMDREEASTYSINVLKYTWTEFSRIYNIFDRKWGEVYLKGFYLYMAIAFCGEYKRTLIRANYNFGTQECSNYYKWFREKIQYALSHRIIIMENFSVSMQDELLLLIHEEEAFAHNLEKSEKMIENRWENVFSKSQGKKVVVFGAGHWGREALKHFDKKNALNNIMAFADNDIGKNGKNVAGIHIYSVYECTHMYPYAVYLIANLKYHEEINKQLEKMKIPTENIIDMFS